MDFIKLMSHLIWFEYYILLLKRKASSFLKRIDFLSKKCRKTPFFRAESRQVLQRLKHKNLIKKVIAFRLPNDIIAPLLHSGDTFYVY